MLTEDELVCPSCGNLRTVCTDPEVAWYPQRTVCYATAARDVTVRKLAKRYEKSPPGTEMHATDGVSVWVSTEDLTPEDDFV